MTQNEAERWADELVKEMICYNKIKMGVKNIWAEKIVKFLIDEKKDYNQFQNDKVMRSIPTMAVDEGIGGLLEFMSSTNCILESHRLEDKKQDLSASQLKDEWKKEFLSMSFNDQVDKATSWLTCGCPESSVPKFIMDWVRGLEDESLVKVMRLNFKEGRARWNKLVGISDIAKNFND